MRMSCAIALLVLVSACEKKEEVAPAETAAAPAQPTPAAQPVALAAQAKDAVAAGAPSPQAKAELKGLNNSGVNGTIIFTATADGGVQVAGNIHGLSAGQHGFHVHETGNCDAPDGSSAGAHFNPGGAPHGDIDAAASHAGDLGNVVADEHGDATVSIIKKTATLAAGSSSLIGKAVIVHKKQDDLKSQPAGDAGDRIACGVIVQG